MCGIIGIIGATVSIDILEGLQRLEYRGYDSAGIATLHDGTLQRRRAEGKLRNLAGRLHQEPLPGDIGIGHTRWATHGAPSENNAHPHATEEVALVHNGIIENFQELRQQLSAKGHGFASETDSEVVAHLLTDYLQQGKTPQQALHEAVNVLEGAYAMAIIFKSEPDVLYGARRGSPLVVGYGDNTMYLGSDALALAPLTNKISYIEEEHYVVLRRDSVTAYDRAGEPQPLDVVDSNLTGASIGKGAYRHFMLKEIYEQPTVIGDTLHALVTPNTGKITLPFQLPPIKAISIAACGTSRYSGMVGQYLLEEIAGLPTSLSIASEYRYRPCLATPGTLAIFISQSGETADTLAALRHAKAHGVPTLTIVNVPSSTMAREADYMLPTLAGPEIGVASTKAFTTQLVVLSALAMALGNNTDSKKYDASQLLQIPAYANQALHLSDAVLEIAKLLTNAERLLYIGRGSQYPIALEGALKLKELSYLHAEGLAAGELKHGPIALIDEDTPTVALAPSGPLFEKTASNIREIHARGGKVLLFSDRQGIAALQDCTWQAVQLPTVDPLIAPAVYTIPIQFLAYHIAVLKGTDVDQPRNLAKSVTVE